MPRVIENHRDLEHFAGLLESLDRIERELTPEERALETLRSRLIEDYDERVELPELPPHRVISLLMEQKDLRQADLLPVFGSRSVTSDVLRGRREPSKAHIRKLAEFFHLSPAVFF
jgi:HTH-type transcriptional regulator/antitoxin HigA